MGLSIGIRLAPGVRLRASPRGVRASVGPRVARAHVGTGGVGLSSGVGPFTASATSSGGRRARKPGKPQPAAKRPRGTAGSRLEGLQAGLELAATLSQMLSLAEKSYQDVKRDQLRNRGRDQARRRENEILAASSRAADLLTKLHLKNFPVEQPPAMDSPPRRMKKLWRIDDADVARRCEADARAQARWQRLRDHDQQTVIATVDAAFAENASHSTCIDAGQTDEDYYVTCVVRYPGPEVGRGLVKDGRKVRERNNAEIAALYKEAVASTVIATAKEAFCSAPSTTYVRVLVLRYDIRGVLKRRPRLDAIYAGTFARNLLDINWGTSDPVDVLVGARDVVINDPQTRPLKPLGEGAGQDLRELIDAMEMAEESAQ